MLVKTYKELRNMLFYKDICDVALDAELDDNANYNAAANNVISKWLAANNISCDIQIFDKVRADFDYYTAQVFNC